MSATSKPVQQSPGSGARYFPVLDALRFVLAGGAWSYSLYLVHAQGVGIYNFLRLPALGLIPDWFIVMAMSLAAGYIFYLLVERPSHALARKIKVKSVAPRAAFDAVPEPAATVAYVPPAGVKDPL